MFLTALIFGLLGSFHCIGMCGPIALVLPVHHNNTFQKGLNIMLYHLGRILAYGSIGFLFGWLGKGLYLSGFQQRLSILIGLVMIGSMLIPSAILNRFSITQSSYVFIGKLKSSLAQQLKRKDAKALFSVGFLNGFLPCGMVYMALAGAIATARPSQGFLYMVIYGIGTVPLMTVLLYFKNAFSLKFRNKIQKAIPVFVVLIGLLFVLRGFGLGIPFISPSDANLQVAPNAEVCL